MEQFTVENILESLKGSIPDYFDLGPFHCLYNEGDEEWIAGKKYRIRRVSNFTLDKRYNLKWAILRFLDAFEQFNGPQTTIVEGVRGNPTLCKALELRGYVKLNETSLVLINPQSEIMELKFRDVDDYESMLVESKIRNWANKCALKPKKEKQFGTIRFGALRARMSWRRMCLGGHDVKCMCIDNVTVYYEDEEVFEEFMHSFVKVAREHARVVYVSKNSNLDLERELDDSYERQDGGYVRTHS